MARHSTTMVACLLFLTLLVTLSIKALPTPQPSSTTPQLFRFEVNAPQMDALWLVDTLPMVSWDTTQMPKGSTMDIALLHHEKKQSILLRRYVPTRLGSTLVNVRPDLIPGTYSLLLTVFKGRTSTVLGRSLVQSIILVENESADFEEMEILRRVAEPETATEQPSITHKVQFTEFSLKKQNQNAVEEPELVQLTHQPTKGNLVLRAPYTVGWSIPKALEEAQHVRVNLLLVSMTNEVVRVLATNIDAKIGFLYVFLPEDVPLTSYQIKVEIIGNGRKFSGYTNKFRTSLPAFSTLRA
ncbi:hypothetical protein BGZ51_002502 [Haplosporangium sp. Z 767]|nr:hypothetical protein BGZ51_002502 [Haplosporangium sp. Z 767]KAF9186456.1 hypothetical protein BGZ50_002448 [Haplosporangium sp. Z 11]